MTIYETLARLIFGKRNKEWKFPVIKNNVVTKWGWAVSHVENFTMGKNTDIGFSTYIQAEHRVVIQDNVQIGAHCSIYSKNTIDNTHGRIIIESNACIGAGTVILPKKDGTDLIIGRNSKVGAMSLVINNIEPNTVYYGIPAARKGDKT